MLALSFVRHLRNDLTSGAVRPRIPAIPAATSAYIVVVSQMIVFMFTVIHPLYLSYRDDRAAKNAQQLDVLANVSTQPPGEQKPQAMVDPGRKGINTATLESILDNPALAKELRVFSASQFALEPILFYEQLRQLFQLVATDPSTTVTFAQAAPAVKPSPRTTLVRQTEEILQAMSVLMTTYVMPGAELEVNFEMKARRETIQRFKQLTDTDAPLWRSAVPAGAGGVPEDKGRQWVEFVFARAKRDVERLIKENTLPPFLVKLNRAAHVARSGQQLAKA